MKNAETIATYGDICKDCSTIPHFPHHWPLRKCAVELELATSCESRTCYDARLEALLAAAKRRVLDLEWIKADVAEARGDVEMIRFEDMNDDQLAQLREVYERGELREDANAVAAFLRYKDEMAKLKASAAR